MAELIVLAFKGIDTANQAEQVLEQAQKQFLVELADAAIVQRPADGKPKIRQLRSLTGAGALGGAFWGMLIGLLFFMPFVGLAIGAAAGAIVGKFMDIGIPDDFIKEVGQTVEVGDSALFLLVNKWNEERVIEMLAQYKPAVVRTNLSAADEEKLKAAFATAEGASAAPAAPEAPEAPEAPASA
ncbi:MAG: DUF1269 domain-containing protein [Anaerolineae bacterium]